MYVKKYEEEILNNELNTAKNNKILTTYSYKNENLYELTKENVINVETMILYNTRYSNFNDKDISIENFKNNPEEFLDKESSTAIIKLIKNDLRNEEIFETNYKAISLKNVKGNLIFHILKKINKENSTRVSINNIKNMTKIINEKCNKSIEKLFAILENINDGYKLIGKLTVIKGNNENFSLATKFCHYMCINYFDDSERRDNYSIYDNVVSENLPKYYEFFKKELIKKDIKYNELPNTKKDKLKARIKKVTSHEERENKYIEFYKEYQKLIDDIREVAAKKYNKQKISRNGFDHILWYTNK